MSGSVADALHLTSILLGGLRRTSVAWTPTISIHHKQLDAFVASKLVEGASSRAAARDAEDLLICFDIVLLFTLTLRLVSDTQAAMFFSAV